MPTAGLTVGDKFTPPYTFIVTGETRHEYQEMFVVEALSRLEESAAIQWYKKLFHITP